MMVKRMERLLRWIVGAGPLPRPNHPQGAINGWLGRGSGPAPTSKFALSRISTKNGFSLVELMVVLFIIGLLSAVVLINVLPSQDKARVVKARADIATLSQALELYRLDAGRYPDEAEGLAALKAGAGEAGGPAGARANGYVRDIPNDPWGRPYQYHVPGTNGRPFAILSLGADGKPGGTGNDADIGEAGGN